MTNLKDTLKDLISVSSLDDLPDEIRQMRLMLPLRIFTATTLPKDEELLGLALDLLILFSSETTTSISLFQKCPNKVTLLKHVSNLSVDKSTINIAKAQALLNNLTTQKCWCEVLQPILPTERLVDLMDLSYVTHHSADFFPQILLNMTQCGKVRLELGSEKSRLAQVISKCQARSSPLKRRIAISGIMKNLCYEEDLHDSLLDCKELDFLSLLLFPLCDRCNKLDEDEMFRLPTSLQFIPGDQKTVCEKDATVKCNLLEALLWLCSKPFGRKRLWENGCYLVLRELEKVEQDRRVLLAIENVNPLICGKEPDDEALLNVRSVEVPLEVQQEVERVKQDFVEVD